MHRTPYLEQAAVQLASLSPRLVQLATERLDITDPAVRGQLQRVLRAEQELDQALAALAQALSAAGAAPEQVESDLEARAAGLRDLQSEVLLAVAARD